MDQVLMNRKRALQHYYEKKQNNDQSNKIMIQKGIFILYFD